MQDIVARPEIGKLLSLRSDIPKAGANVEHPQLRSSSSPPVSPPREETP